MRLILGRAGEGLQAPLTKKPGGRLLPLSPDTRVLFNHIDQAEALAIQQQQATALRLAGEAFQNQLRQTPLFKPNPLAQYEQAHTWIDPNGHTLSDRIWRTAGNTRRKLDMFLEDAIREGRGTLNLENRGATGLARDLEQFLMPGRQLRRTSKPYGIDASYDAMRLARTEITRAHAKAFENTAELNTFVTGLIWNLSGSHPKIDICDTHAENSPYPLGTQPTMPAHPHDMCYWSNVITDSPKAVMNQLA
jgi:hypothetical protein